MIENLLALWIAIKKNCPPEVAFKYIDKFLDGDTDCLKKELYFKWTNKEVESLIKFREEGLTYKEIAEIYGVGERSIINAIKNYRKKEPFTEGSKLKITMSV